MRRRRALALGTAAVGLTGYGWYTTTSDEGFEKATSTPTTTGEEETTSSGKTPTDAGAANIGGSLNGRPHLLSDNLPLVERSNTNWMHAFLDVRSKYESNTDPRSDPDIKTLRRVSQEMGVNLIISLRWNFIGIYGNIERTNVPPSGSSREAALYAYATKLLDAIEDSVEVVVLGNEPIWETPDEDVQGKDSPFMEFTRGLKNHLVRNYTADPQLLLGSFNRLYDDYVQDEYGQFYGQLFDMARNDDDIDGIDLHVHYDGLDQAETMLATARKEVPDGTLTTTEFSPMWRYTRNTDKRITSFEGGRAFIDRYGFSDDMTVRGYFEVAKDDPRPRSEMGEFMETMPWYNVNFVEDMYDLLIKYGAEVGTFGFLQDVGIRNAEWGDDWRPFQINYLFQRGLIATDDGAHPHYLDDYRRRS